MHPCQNEHRITVSPEFYIVSALLLLLLPIKWILAWTLATFVHESFHYLAIRLNKVSVLSITLGLNGITMTTETMSRTAELVSALAGPLGALSLLTLAKWLPLTAICAYFQSVYNLLPIFPLDGGRALRCFTMQLLPVQQAEKVCRIIETVILILISILGIFSSIWLRLGAIPLIATGLLLLKSSRVKFPCKDGKQRVQ